MGYGTTQPGIDWTLDRTGLSTSLFSPGVSPKIAMMDYPLHGRNSSLLSVGNFECRGFGRGWSPETSWQVIKTTTGLGCRKEQLLGEGTIEKTTSSISALLIRLMNYG